MSLSDEEDDFDVDDLMEGFEEELAVGDGETSATAAIATAGGGGGDGSATAAAATAGADDDEDEEDKQGRGATGAAGASGALLTPTHATPALYGSPSPSRAAIAASAAAATASGSGSGGGPAASKPAAKKKRKSTAASAAARKESPAAMGAAGLDDERAAKLQRTELLVDAEAAAKAKVWQSRLSSSDHARLEVYQSTNLRVDHMRRVLSALTAPLPAAKLPPVAVATMSALGKLLITEVMEEALRVQTAQLQRLGWSSSAAQQQPLKPAAVNEAYQNLVAAGRIPSRTTTPPARGAGGSRAMSSGADAADQLAPPASAPAPTPAQPRRAKVWRSGAAASQPIDVAEDPSAASDADWTYPDLRLDLASNRAVLTPQSSASFARYSQDEIDQLVGELMKFILQRSSASLPVSHKEVVQLMGDRAKGGAGKLIDDARRRFLTLYGYELAELGRRDTSVVSADTGSRKRKAAEQTSASNKSFILRVPAPCRRTDHMARAFNFGLMQAGGAHSGDNGGADDHAAADGRPISNVSESVMGLLHFLYTVLYLDEQNAAMQQSASVYHGCTEENLWRALQRADPELSKHQKRHDLFGNVSDLIDHFVKQQYLDKVKVAGAVNRQGDEGVSVYRKGPRGDAEIGTKAVYTAMCQLMMNEKPDKATLNQIDRDQELRGGAKAKPAAPGAASQQ